jgi:hypothetical protein
MQLLQKTKTMNLSNRSNVMVAFESLCVELERRIRDEHHKTQRRKSTSDDVRARLKAIDFNGNGQIDVKELLIGCRELGIPMSLAELEMVWPLFKPDIITGKILCTRHSVTCPCRLLARLLHILAPPTTLLHSILC